MITAGIVRKYKEFVRNWCPFLKDFLQFTQVKLQIAVVNAETFSLVKCHSLFFCTEPNERE